jgi:hypothetical protein
MVGLGCGLLIVHPRHFDHTQVNLATRLFRVVLGSLGIRGSPQFEGVVAQYITSLSFA